jgi:hypothetical protein
MNSIEWLMEQLTIHGYGAVKTFPELFEKAEAMHKAEIIDAYMDRMDCTNKEELAKIIGREYYEKTFKKK